jgi:DNA-binding NarL/FixJ family response regulator
MAVRVHLADDHTMFREGLEAILASHEGIEVVGTSSTGGEDAVALVAENRLDVVVTQIDTDPGTARGVLSRIREASPESRIVVLTMFDNLRYLRALSKLGIDAYIHKSSSADDLVATLTAEAVREPGEGNVVVSMPRGLLERLWEEPMGALSERETEVVVLAARGFSNARIAEELGVAEATVKRHLANIYEKVGVHSRTEVVRTALLEQWIGIHEIASASADGDGSDGQGG